MSPAALKRNLLVNLVPEVLLTSDAPLDAVRAGFGRFVREVEVENHSYCNRTCSFCPNAFLDRRSETHVMTDTVFEKILDGLASIDYSGRLIWSRYSEVLAHESIYERLAAARRALPAARLEAISNGDYLTPETLGRLEAAGLDVLGVDLYDDTGTPPSLERNELLYRRFEKRTGLARGEAGAFGSHRMTGSTVAVYCGTPNFEHEFAAHGLDPAAQGVEVLGMSTRGGLMDVPRLRGYRRTSACLHTLIRPTIDYNGKGVYCCHVRSDSPAHAGVTVGDLSAPGYTLFHLYRDLGEARRGLLTSGPKAGVCGGCNSSAEPASVSRRPWLARSISWAAPLVLGLAARQRHAARRAG